MDINLLRSLVTVAGFVLFLAIVGWAYLPARREQFDDAAELPFKSE